MVALIILIGFAFLFFGFLRCIETNREHGREVKRISEVRRLERERDAIIAARRHAEATVTDEDIRRGRLLIWGDPA